MIIKRLEEIVRINPNKIVYKYDDRYITYKELYDKCFYYSKLLIKEGSGPVIIYGSKELNTFISIISCIIARRTYIPIDKFIPLERFKNIIRITNSSLIISDEDISIDNVKIKRLEDLELYKNDSDKIQNNSVAYIIFTSGSTGEAKGVPITYNNLNNFIKWISSLYPLNEYKDVNVLNQASFSFDLSVADIYYSLYNNHTLISYSNYNAVFNVIKRESINVCVMTPTFIKMLLLNDEFNISNYPSLKCIYFCGEVLEKRSVLKLFERFPDISIINAYGPTEATSAVCGILITKDILNEDVLPVGDIRNSATEISIINNEIVLKGDSVFSGYLGNYKGGYYKDNGINAYKTGDLGYIKNNKIYCKGRLDNQIKYKGYRIELNDIKNNILKINGVIDAEVIAKYTEDNIVKSIKAFVVLDRSVDIKDELRKLLPSYMIPKSIKVLDKLPINNNGKIDRKALYKL